MSTAPNHDTHDQRVEYRTIRSSTEGEADQKLNELSQEGFKLVSAAAGDAFWAVCLRISWIPKAVKAVHDVGGMPSPLGLG